MKQQEYRTNMLVVKSQTKIRWRIGSNRKKKGLEEKKNQKLEKKL